MKDSRPLLLGHRGLRSVRRLRRSSAPSRRDLPAENTLAAFEYAVTHGCDGFEFDVRYTSDAYNVLCHDAEFRGHEIATVAFADLNRPRRWGQTVEAIPRLEDVLSTFGSRAYLDVELKVSGHEESVVAALRAQPPVRGYVVTSFLPEVLLRIHEIDPSIPLGYLCDAPEEAHRWKSAPIRIFLPHHKLVSPALIDEVHGRKLQLMTWTVNRERDMRRLAGWGVDGLISDDPALLRRVFPD